MTDRPKFMGDAPTREDRDGHRSVDGLSADARTSPASFPGVLSDREAGSGVLHSASETPGKAKRPPSFTAAQRLAVFEAFGALVCCQGDGCENVMRIKGCDIDHHLAIIDGGTHELSNWRPLCDPCHAKKSAREHKANWHCKRVAHARAVHEAVLAGTHKREPSRIKSRGFAKVKKPWKRWRPAT